MFKILFPQWQGSGNKKDLYNGAVLIHDRKDRKEAMLILEKVDATRAEGISHIIRNSFKKQAELLGIRKEEYPNFVAFETVEGVQNRIKNGDHIVIAYYEDEPIGTISYKIDSKQLDKGYIKRLAVLPEFRGNKYGELLMDYAETWLKKNQISRIELSIVAQFDRLQRYYERLGYIPRERKSFSSLPFEVLYMEKTIK